MVEHWQKMNYLILIILSLQLFSACGIRYDHFLVQDIAILYYIANSFSCLFVAPNIRVDFPLLLYGPEYGDHPLPKCDDCPSSLISLSVSFPYFGNYETDLYVSHTPQNCIMC